MTTLLQHETTQVSASTSAPGYNNVVGSKITRSYGFYSAQQATKAGTALYCNDSGNVVKVSKVVHAVSLRAAVAILESASDYTDYKFIGIVTSFIQKLPSLRSSLPFLLDENDYLPSMEATNNRRYRGSKHDRFEPPVSP